jgi:hypothetical protein
MIPDHPSARIKIILPVIALFLAIVISSQYVLHLAIAGRPMIADMRPPDDSFAPIIVAPLSQPLLKTQDFETGKRRMADVSSKSLEAFLQDLNRRKDYDYSCHNNQPGPDSAYLWQWVVRTTMELQRRGYTSDAAGSLFRPNGESVPLR